MAIELTTHLSARLPSNRRGFSLSKWLRAVRETANERRQLRWLDDRMLRDMGIDPQAAQNEAARNFWDLPARRRV